MSRQKEKTIWLKSKNPINDVEVKTNLNSADHFVTPSIHYLHPLRETLGYHWFRIQLLHQTKKIKMLDHLRKIKIVRSNQWKTHSHIINCWQVFSKPTTENISDQSNLESSFLRAGTNAPHVTPLSIRASGDNWTNILRHLSHHFLHLLVHWTYGHLHSFGSHSHLCPPTFTTT